MPMRVCIVRHSFYPGDDRARREAEALRDAGVEVDVVSLCAPGERLRDVVDGVRVIRLPLQRRRASQARYIVDYATFLLVASPTVAMLHGRRHYGVVQVNTMPDLLVFAALIPKLLGSKVLLDMHELMPELYATKFEVPSDHPYVRLVAASERMSVAFADAVITVSHATEHVLLDRGVEPDKLTVVMNAPDGRYFAQRVNVPPLRDDRLRLISHGTLVERYGFDTAIRAMAIVRERFPQARLTIVGDGELAPTLKKLVSDLDLDAHVELIGFRPLEEIAGLLAEAHVGISANKLDAFTDLILPTKLLEYVTVGVPAVVARARAVTMYFDSSCVRSFRPDDVEDLACAIEELASDPARAATMAERAARGFVPLYGWEQMGRRYVELVQRLATEERSPITTRVLRALRSSAARLAR
jgi:glycosyltransferase involved in cell wall biosynthesis